MQPGKSGVVVVDRAPGRGLDPVHRPPRRLLSKSPRLSSNISHHPSSQSIEYTMILRSALAAGVLALQASAFLVPVEVVKEVEAAKARLESLWLHQAFTVELACPGCAFHGPPQDGVEYSGADENTIVSRFNSMASDGMTDI